ncbi:putative nuclease HARBI1 [Rhagoletis pomonella]|uniref:putative nuclease HARBI1 n=1 Tax=Rhagoletis pomonella TaxID=28610 RepID=UPI0017862DF2|nr:putative nuclease HARBI1 [Rhagoletis pomonella]
MEKIFFVGNNLINELLESSSSSSDDEEIGILLHPKVKCLRVKDFVDEVLNLYTDREFKRNFRVERESAQYLIAKYESSSSYVRRNYRGGRPQATPSTHVLLFLWFCSNKTTIREVSNLFNMSYSSVHNVLNNVMSFLLEISPDIIKFPESDTEKEIIAHDFAAIYGFPNVLGCIAETYISTRAPKKTVRSTYINRHDTISVPMQGICDANLKFIDVFTGAPSKVHESRLLKLSFISKKLPKLCLPKYHLLGDSAYPIRNFLLIPYMDYGNLTEQEKMYNYKLSQTRMRIENAFGLLKCRFRQLMRLDFLEVETTTKFIMACCVLHNICIDKQDVIEGEEYCAEPASVREHFHSEVSDSVLTELGEMKRSQIKSLF